MVTKPVTPSTRRTEAILLCKAVAIPAFNGKASWVRSPDWDCFHADNFSRERLSVSVCSCQEDVKEGKFTAKMKCSAFAGGWPDGS